MGWVARYLLVEGLTEEEKGSVDLTASDRDEAAQEAHSHAEQYAGANAIDLYSEGQKVTRLWTAL